MSLDEDVGAFRVWATKLGCPPDVIPNEDALKLLFKSRQSCLFRNLIKRVKPRQEVKEIRENILISKMEKLKDQVIPISQRSYLPKQMQTYLKVKDLQKQKEDLTVRLEQCKREFQTLADTIKQKNIQSIILEQKAELLEDKVILLQMKKESLDKAIKKEDENKEKILATMPVKLSDKNASELAAMEAVEKAIKELETFYNLHHNNNNNANALQEAKDDLWRKMRTTFKNIPNFLIFNAILRLKDDQLQTIVALNKNNLDESHTRSLSGLSSAKEPLSMFQLKLARTQADLLGLVAKYLAARQERLTLEAQFSTAYGPFVDELQKKVNLLNGTTNEHSEETISDYIVQYNLRNFSKSQNEFLAEQIELFKAEIDSGAKQLDNHEVLLGSIHQVYQDINNSINRVHYEMMQLNQIKEKILYSKNMMKLQLDDMQTAMSAAGAKSNFVSAKLKMNPNISLISTGGFGMTVDSFDYGSDSLLCSTKLDFDTTTTTLNNTTLRRSFGAADSKIIGAAANEARGPSVPPHTLELSIFVDMPLEKLHCLSRDAAFHLARNPLIVESSELPSTLQVAPGTILTPYGALQEVRNRIVWANLIAQHSNAMKLDLDLVFVNAKVLKENSRKQHEHVIELLDKIDVTNINTERRLTKLTKLYDFILENPMRHYVPSSKKFNNQAYTDYENEYTMYYRMAKAGSSN